MGLYRNMATAKRRARRKANRQVKRANPNYCRECKVVHGNTWPLVANHTGYRIGWNGIGKPLTEENIELVAEVLNSLIEKWDNLMQQIIERRSH